MKIVKILHDKKWKERFYIDIKTEYPSIVNALVHIISTYIESYSFGDMDMTENSSTIKSEQLSQMIRLINVKQSLVDKNTFIELDTTKLTFPTEGPYAGYREIYSRDLWPGDLKKIPFNPNIYLITLRAKEVIKLKCKINKSYARLDNAYTSVGRIGHMYLKDSGVLRITVNILESCSLKTLINNGRNRFIEFIGRVKNLFDSYGSKEGSEGRYTFKLEDDDVGLYTVLYPLVQVLERLDEGKKYMIAYDQNHPQIEEHDFIYDGPKKNIYKALNLIKNLVDKGFVI